MTKKIFILIMTLIIALSLFSCAKETNTESSTETETETEASSPYQWPEKIPDDAEFDGEFRILNFGNTGGSHWSEYAFIYDDSLQGDVLNDSIRTRDSVFEEKYGVKIEYITCDRDEMTDYIRRSVNSGSDDFDICVPNMSGAATLASEGLFLDLWDGEFSDIFDFEADYWDHKCNKQLSINNKLFFALGDLTLCDKQATWVIYFVKSVVEKYKLCEDVDNSIYSLVDNGTWTISRMYEMVKAASHDVDGDGIMTDQDAYGQIGEISNLSAFMVGVGSLAVAKDENDIPYYCWGDQIDELTNDYRMVHDIVRNEQYATHANALQTYGGYEDKHVEGVGGMMTRGLCLFSVTGMNRCMLYRDLDCEFGIVPFPKHDEKQKEYYSMMAYECGTCVALPITLKDAARAAMLLEAYECIASQTSYNAYMEKALQYKLLRDDDSYDMLKIIFDSRRIEISDAYGWGGGTITVFKQDISPTAIASSVKKVETQMKKMIEKGLKKYLDNTGD